MTKSETMLKAVILLLFPLILLAGEGPTKEWVLVVHGGAGSIDTQNLDPSQRQRYEKALTAALDAGAAILDQGGSALDAVQAAVMILEDDSLFNAGRGAVFTAGGTNELDASIMDGRTLRAGAVAGIKTIRNPICAARKVMEESGHVFLTGKGAERFAQEQGCMAVDPAWFFTEARWKSLLRAKKADSLTRAGDTIGKTRTTHRDWKYGTVGAVALDRNGNLAAATSTGGMTNKKFGRVGDSPMIGAGTYADNKTCAISCTGWGEYFIRLVMAKSVSDRMELAGMSLANAANEMILKKLPALGGDGGLIAVDHRGNIAMPFNTKGMFRGIARKDFRQISIGQ